METESSVQVYSLKLIKDYDLKFKRVRDSQDAREAMRAFLCDCDCENMAVLLLDSNGNMLGIARVSIGGIAGLQCRCRDVFKAAILANAAAIILGHNHPSGNVEPSQEDIVFTDKVEEAGHIMGISVMDHLIVSSGLNDDVFSFNDKGLIG